MSPLREPLLDRIRRDPADLVRYHAADSLLELADIYPRDIGDHPAIAAALYGAKPEKPSLLGLLGLDPPLTPEQLARFADAARLLDAAITARLAAGPCSKRVPLTIVDLHILRLNERTVALTVEDSIGSCQRALAFVAFLQSPGGFGPWLSSEVSGKDPLTALLETLPTHLTVEYRRATKELLIGSFLLDTRRANVVVLSADATGVVARFQGTRDLVFERHGRGPSFGLSLSRFQPEIAAEVRALVNGSPELHDLIAAVRSTP